MDNLKKSIVSGVIASVLMITDFDIGLPTEQINALDSQQSLATLTAFSGWSLGLNEAEAGCADNNSCNEEFDTMVIIGDPIDDGWGDWEFWNWDFGNYWDEFWDDYWNTAWEYDFGGIEYQDKNHCLVQVNNVTNACFGAAGTGSAVVATSCAGYAAALGPVGLGICGVTGVVTAGGTFMLCAKMSSEAINRCHEMFPN